MKQIKYFFWSLLLVMTLLWMFADTFLPEPFTYFRFRNVFVQYTGIIAIVTMSVSLYLALRPVWLEQRLDGLDKVYRLHKWLGIAALVASILHWWWAKGSKWLVQAGILEAPQQHRKGQEGFSGIHGFFADHRGQAEQMGEIAFYAFLILLIIALAKKIPYRTFIKSHRILAILFIVLVVHSIILMKFSYWFQPVGIVTGLFMAVGLVSAIGVLLGRIGAGRKIKGHVTFLDYYPELQVNEIDLLMDEEWPGHKAGQFAFVQSTRKERAHPYTIASAWDPKERKIKFITKALGDYTRTLHDVLQIDEKAVIEGPYGHFTFDDNKNQIWIGGGIGITPFIAKMQDLQLNNNTTKNITLFHTTKEYSEKALAKIKSYADASGIVLHILHDERDGFLTGEKLRQLVSYWQHASVWFCGPAGFGKALKKDLQAHGFSPENFHQELFEMR